VPDWVPLIQEWILGSTTWVLAMPPGLSPSGAGPPVPPRGRGSGGRQVPSGGTSTTSELTTDTRIYKPANQAVPELTAFRESLPSGTTIQSLMSSRPPVPRIVRAGQEVDMCLSYHIMGRCNQGQLCERRADHQRHNREATQRLLEWCTGTVAGSAPRQPSSARGTAGNSRAPPTPRSNSPAPSVSNSSAVSQ
jgi:hypothetical protein